MSTAGTGDMRARIAAAEARMVCLREENAALERLLLRPKLFGARLGMCILASAIAGTTGYLTAMHIGSTRDAHEAALEAAAHVKRMTGEHYELGTCKSAASKIGDDLASCRGDRLPAPAPPPLDPSRGHYPYQCTCDAMDPLCTCHY